jgi:hypothetical protein
MYQNTQLDTPVATHGFTPRGVLLWQNMLNEVSVLRAQVNRLNNVLAAVLPRLEELETKKP